MYPFDKTQRLANNIMLFFGSKVIKAWPGWKMKIFGAENYDNSEAKIIISNHQSFLDMPIQAGIPLNFKWVSKAELFNVPIMGWFMRLTRQLSVTRGKSSATDLLNQAVPMLKKGVSICIFPEGTRTRNGELLPFKKGAFLLAKEAGVKIQPLIIHGTYFLNQPDDWRFKEDGEIQLHVMEPIDPKNFATIEELMAYTADFYQERLSQIRSKSFADAELTH